MQLFRQLLFLYYFGLNLNIRRYTHCIAKNKTNNGEVMKVNNSISIENSEINEEQVVMKLEKFDINDIKDTSIQEMSEICTNNADLNKVIVEGKNSFINYENWKQIYDYKGFEFEIGMLSSYRIVFREKEQVNVFRLPHTSFFFVKPSFNLNRLAHFVEYLYSGGFISEDMYMKFNDYTEEELINTIFDKKVYFAKSNYDKDEISKLQNVIKDIISAIDYLSAEVPLQIEEDITNLSDKKKEILALFC
jgi:anion-transporting  ArsA/GET3 family ATPase